MIKSAESLMNTSQDIELNDIINLVNHEYSTLVEMISNIYHKLDEIFSFDEERQNYYEKLIKYVDKEHLSIVIQLEISIRNMLHHKSKLNSLQLKDLEINQSPELLKDNIEKFENYMKEAYIMLNDLTKNIDEYSNKVKKTDDLTEEKIKEYKELVNTLKESKNKNYSNFVALRKLYKTFTISKSLSKKLEKGFFGFWVRRFRVSLIALIMIILYGGASLYTIPKESSPDIEFGILSINTIYNGVNPEDIDNLITNKIEKEIKDVNGIKKISSTSSLGISTIIIELNEDKNAKEALVDIKDKVDKVSLPSEAEDPIVTEITNRGDTMFDLMIYAHQDDYSLEDLKEKARKIKNILESKSGISKVDYSFSNDYDILVLLDKSKIEVLGLSITEISNAIQQYNQNQPIGNYTIGEKNYDFRFNGELTNISQIAEIPIKYTQNSLIKIKDIGNIKKDYKSKSITRIGFSDSSGYYMISMIVEKSKGANIFDSSKKAKTEIKQILETDEFKGIQANYGIDLAELVREDYESVAKSGLQTLALVFIVLLIFIGFQESIIGTLAVPLAFLVTFAVLKQLGLSLNFLTNFSLILSFGIAIDTTIVIIEGANELLKQGYNPKNAVLLAVRSYAAPLISGTMTTLAAFLPMMTLPGIMGKFLAYIPITVFSTLLAALVISLTINSMLFFKLNKPLKYYYEDEEADNKLDKEEKELLVYERRGKKPIENQKKSFRDRIFDKLKNFYKRGLLITLKNKLIRLLTIFLPIIALIFTFVFISPKLGFQMFPYEDSEYLYLKVYGPVGTDEKYMQKYVSKLEKTLMQIPNNELDIFDVRVQGSQIDTTIKLHKKDFRKISGGRKSEQIEKWLSNELKWIVNEEGMKFETNFEAGGPPIGEPIGIKLIAENNKQFNTLMEVAKDFEDFLRGLKGTKNVGNSSEETPGQYVFRLDENKLVQLGLTPNNILSEIYFATNGSRAGSFKGEIDDFDIKVKYEEFHDSLSPSDISNLYINTPSGKIKVGNVLQKSENGEFAEFTNAIKLIGRENNRIMIRVFAHNEPNITPDKIMVQLLDFAKNYNYPSGIRYEAGGETEENMDLIVATLVSFVVALFLIFLILVLQFATFGQPLVILYSVVLALLGVNLGLYFTNNTYSMPFAIGFIALTGVVVNDAIVLIDRFNKNKKKGLEDKEAVIEAGLARLIPIMLTTITTLLGILPIAMQDKFWEGLGFTIVFGLFFGSIMTLNVIPALLLEQKFMSKVIFFPFWIVYVIIKFIIKIFVKLFSKKKQLHITN